MKQVFSLLSLSRQFLLVSFPILLAGTIYIGTWIGEQVEDSVVHRIGSVTALYVESFIAPHVQAIVATNDLSEHEREMLRSDLVGTPLGQKIVALKIWRKDGRVLFSTDASEIGKTLSIDEGLETALSGHIFAEISERSVTERSSHGQPMPRLIEIYTPIHADRTGEVIAAAEFYERTDEVDRASGIAQWASWRVVAGTMLAMYVGLFFVVRKGSQTIDEQRTDLRRQLNQLTTLNAQNDELQKRVVRAAERATEVNESLLQRISADIHDGPVQDLGFALMQMKNLSDQAQSANPAPDAAWVRSVEQSGVALTSALAELRAISADLDLPEIKDFSPGEIAGRVVRAFHSKTGAEAALEIELASDEMSLRAKVALYRVLQESLANVWRHAQGQGCRVLLKGDAHQLVVTVSDAGPGFDVPTAVHKGRLGLHGMRQRVEVLGGAFDVSSELGVGTTVRVVLPLLPVNTSDD